MQKHKSESSDNIHDHNTVRQRRRELLQAASVIASGNFVCMLLSWAFFRYLGSGLTALVTIPFVVLIAWLEYALLRTAMKSAKPESSIGEMELHMLRTAVDSLPDLIYVKDAKSRFLFANVSTRESMTGSAQGELVGKDDFEFFPRSVASAFFEDEQAIIRTGQSMASKPELIHDPTGAARWILTTKVPYYSEEDRISGIIGIGRDITAQKKSEEDAINARIQAEAASRAKSEFLANMSHEIRTPLNGIIGMTDLALDTELTLEQQEFLTTVKLSADALLAVINDILDFSKIEAGKVDVEAVDFDIRECIETSLKTLVLRAEEKGIELLCDISPDLPEVICGDPTRLRQVLLNLVGNAIKFTSEGQIAIESKIETKNSESLLLHFVVSDTGIGISEEKQNVIFNAFTQADTSTTRQFGGTGLGLTITSRLVEMMGGKIWVVSQIGKGSEFHFTVQCAVGTAPKTEPNEITPNISLAGVRVLVVDDNGTNRQILEKLLTRWGMQPTCVGSGADAIAALNVEKSRSNSYQLILTDMHMPTMDGLTFVEFIRTEMDDLPSTIMMLSSTGWRGDTARCRELGISAHLIKPVRQKELREAISRSLVQNGRKADGQLPKLSKPQFERRVGFRVLVAEDNLVNQRLVQHLLEKRGHQTTLAGNGREALERTESERYDLVLMDVQMPELDGLQATRLIREREKISGEHLKIVALTAHAVKGDEDRCLDAGMDGYLSKPIRQQELDALLQSLRAETQ